MRGTGAYSCASRAVWHHVSHPEAALRAGALLGPDRRVPTYQTPALADSKPGAGRCTALAQFARVAAASAAIRCWHALLRHGRGTKWYMGHGMLRYVGLIDERSFIDYLLLSEITNNADSYHFNT